jgi:hypothetical protein
MGAATLKLQVGKVRVQTLDGKKEPILPSFWCAPNVQI